MSGHTPGPWWIENEKDSEGPREISDCYGRTAEVYGEGSEGDANARLIAAAPELLAALKEAAQELSLVCKWFDHPEQTTTETLRRATSAIAKAEGSARNLQK
jgi:hypothetical protein